MIVAESSYITTRNFSILSYFAECIHGAQCRLNRNKCELNQVTQKSLHIRQCWLILSWTTVTFWTYNCLPITHNTIKFPTFQWIWWPDRTFHDTATLEYVHFSEKFHRFPCTQNYFPLFLSIQTSFSLMRCAKRVHTSFAGCHVRMILISENLVLILPGIQNLALCKGTTLFVREQRTTLLRGKNWKKNAKTNDENSYIDHHFLPEGLLFFCNKTLCTV